MKKTNEQTNKNILLTGIRDSKLSIQQAKNAIIDLNKIFSCLEFQILPMSSPGDRDRQTDLRDASPDFFTRDIDEALINGSIDCAIHSAKDLPYDKYFSENLIDWFWLPDPEDRRDVLVFPLNPREELKHILSLIKKKSEDIQYNIKIGISSDRRAKYCKQRFKNALLLPVRGNIEERIAQLDEGKYDILIMAAAGLKRLGMENRISEYINIEELESPDGQGFLALTFRKNDRRFCNIRNLFIHPVIIAGSGSGDYRLASLACIEALKNCEVCMYDALISENILDYLPSTAKKIYVGKRNRKAHKTQTEICRMLVDYARQGKKVVRLKAGEPGIFGRLAEELDILDNFAIPSKIIPGISSFIAASDTTGFLTTRRGISRGFIVYTPRKCGSSEFYPITSEEIAKFPHIIFMGASVIPEIVDSLLQQGRSPDEPVAVIYSAGSINQSIVCGSLSNITRKIKNANIENLPGIIFVGDIAHKKFLKRTYGMLSGEKVLITTSDSIINKTVSILERFDALPIPLPMIKTVFSGKYLPQDAFPLKNYYQWLMFTSPSAVNIFIKEYITKNIIDPRELPKIIVSGPATAEQFSRIGITPDIIPSQDFGVKGIIASVKGKLTNGDKILRFKSSLAPDTVVDELNKTGVSVENYILYNNIFISYNSLPYFDSVIFSSPSTITAFIKNFSDTVLRNKTVCLIGETTKKEFERYNIRCNLIIGKEPTIESLVFQLALFRFRQKYQTDSRQNHCGP